MVVGLAPWWMGQTERTTFLTQGDHPEQELHQPDQPPAIAVQESEIPYTPEPFW
jgi:hypothetical protein